METKKTLHVVPADNVEALNICWVVFSMSEQNLYMCGKLCEPSAAGAGPCRAGGAGEEPAAIQARDFVRVTFLAFGGDVLTVLSQQLLFSLLRRTDEPAMCRACLSMHYRIHTQSISRLFPHATPRNEGRMSLRTVLTLLGFAFQ